jgi:internalin A
MKKYQLIWAAAYHYLAVLAMLASCGLGVFADTRDDKKDAPKPVPPEIVKAWRDAGADAGWMKDLPPQPTGGYEYWEPFREKAEAGTVPAYRFHPDKEDVLLKLPDPGVAFGLDFHCSSVKGSWLKNLAGLKSLRSLNVGGSLLLTDEGLKELAELKSLQGLYLFYAPVTDAGLKELAGLKNLQALNLGDTHVTDDGLKELAGLKSLQWLNLRGTKVTAAGVVGLQKDLPKCKIFTADD